MLIPAKKYAAHTTTETLLFFFNNNQTTTVNSLTERFVLPPPPRNTPETQMSYMYILKRLLFSPLTPASPQLSQATPNRVKSPSVGTAFRTLTSACADDSNTKTNLWLSKCMPLEHHVTVWTPVKPLDYTVV